MEKVRFIVVSYFSFSETFFNTDENLPLLPEQVWDRIAPGLDSKFDAPETVPAIAPRPLLILNGIISSSVMPIP